MKFDYIETALITDSEIEKEGQRLIPYIEHIKSVILHNGYDEPEASLNLATDETFLTVSQTLSKQMQPQSLTVLFIIGIGGSNLGTKAIYDALIGHFSALETNTLPRMIFLDTINPSYISQMKAYIAEHHMAPEHYIINVITKSGTTTETIMNLELLLTMLPDALSRLVITTDEGSKLDQAAQAKQLPVLPIPKNVGGRFSIFSNVGLFPLSVMGIDTKKLLEGAFDAREKNTSDEILRNPAAVSAIILYLHAQKGRVINDNFFFNAELESVGKWYRQLMGESIGKNGTGILPTVSIGSTDLHSMVQLYLGGPKNIYTTFYWAKNNTYRKEEEPKVPENTVFTDLVSNINGKRPSEVLGIILKGTQQAYKKNNLPYSELYLDDISEFSLGKLMQFKMIEMMYVGYLFGINTFDQPNVEDYKEETRRILSS
ncbi:MAG: putative glucose-6-phosphate isomerase [Microgenomates group bacterium GW2011_GWC1_41_8]|nr:MAG: putative glucose-6-phosphate isomerase [Microgenomates group bacterium GW2011_GWC1_41_8]